MRKLKSSVGTSRGFTIIEVLIAIAIFALIMIVVLMGVSSLQRAQRNSKRRQMVGIVAAQMEQYRANNQGRYPLDGTGTFSSDDKRCDFIRRYLADNFSGCTNVPKAGGDDCWFATGDNFSVCFHTAGGPHTYSGPLDEISIEISHQCSTTADSGDHLVDTEIGGNTDEVRFAIWTKLEPNAFYCVDSRNPR